MEAGDLEEAVLEWKRQRGLAQADLCAVLLHVLSFFKGQESLPLAASMLQTIAEDLKQLLLESAASKKDDILWVLEKNCLCEHQAKKDMLATGSGQGYRSREAGHRGAAAALWMLSGTVH